MAKVVPRCGEDRPPICGCWGLFQSADVRLTLAVNGLNSLLKTADKNCDDAPKRSYVSMPNAPRDGAEMGKKLG